MILVLYPEKDAPSLWLIKEIVQQKPNKPIVCISDMELVRNTGIDIRLSADSGDGFSITYGSHKIQSENIDFCINTISMLSDHCFDSICDQDTEYVNQEWHSIILCLLSILSHKMIFNRPLPFALNGLTADNKDKGILFAQQIELATPCHYYNSLEPMANMAVFPPHALFFNVVVFKSGCFADERILQYIPFDFQEKLVALLQKLELEIMMVSLVFDQGDFFLREVSSYIDYSMGGTSLVEGIFEKSGIFEPANN